jgi:type IV secretory pathway VirB2 component (pilin)
MKYFLMILFSLQLITVNLFAAATNTYLDEEGVMAVDVTASEGDKNNQLATSLCQIILLLNGRIGRAIAVIAILTLALLFMTSKLTVPVFLTFIVGIALLFGAKSIALVLLPSYVEVKEPDRGVVKKTPEELIKQVCPELK